MLEVGEELGALLVDELEIPLVLAVGEELGALLEDELETPPGVAVFLKAEVMKLKAGRYVPSALFK